MYWIERKNYNHGEPIYELTKNVTDYICNDYNVNSKMCNDMINLSYLHQPAILNLLDKIEIILFKGNQRGYVSD